MTMRAIVSSVAVLFLMTTAWGVSAFAATDCGAAVAAPMHQAGEKWTWRDETGREFSDEVLAEGDLTQMKLPNGDVAFHEKDLIIRQVKRRSGEIVRGQSMEPFVLGLRSVHPTVGQKTLDFPLQLGKEWDYSYFASAARGGRGNLAPFWYSFKVAACEEISTPAGKFPAFKIEVTEIYGDRALPYTSLPTSGVYHLWYAPQVRNYVKRHYEPAPYWIGPTFVDYELVKFDVK